MPPIKLIDTHCHLDFAAFDDDRAQVIAAACEAGVSDFILPGVTASAWPRLIELCREHSFTDGSVNKPTLHFALGMHPCFMSAHQPEHADLLDNALSNNSAIAVGEIGLDGFIPYADLEAQQQLLDAQLSLAKSHHLPVILHVRKAHDQMLKTLRREKLEKGGVVHAFSGSLQQAQQYLDLGFKLGLGGTLTYERAKKLHKTLKALPLSAFVLETDAPDMPLFGYQGERNLPERVVTVAEHLAALKACDLQTIADATHRNAVSVFGDALLSSQVYKQPTY